VFDMDYILIRGLSQWWMSIDQERYWSKTR
jgi:hypothetical protein